MFDPGLAVRSQQKTIRVIRSRDMPSDLLGSTNGIDKIWLNRNILTTKVDERCTLTHELVHLMAGHEGHQPEAVERRVRHQAAALLITAEALLDGMRWTSDLYELAECLAVTPPVMRDRLELPDARSLLERAQIQEWT